MYTSLYVADNCGRHSSEVPLFKSKTEKTAIASPWEFTCYYKGSYVKESTILPKRFLTLQSEICNTRWARYWVHIVLSQPHCLLFISHGSLLLWFSYSLIVPLNWINLDKTGMLHNCSITKSEWDNNSKDRVAWCKSPCLSICNLSSNISFDHFGSSHSFESFLHFILSVWNPWKGNNLLHHESLYEEWLRRQQFTRVCSLKR